MEQEQIVDSATLDLVGQLANLGLWHWNMATERVACSHRLQKMLGIEQPKPSLTLADFQAPLHPDERKRIFTAFSDHFSNATPLRLEHRLRQPNGEYIAVRTNAKCLRDSSGTPVYSVGSIEDISEQLSLDNQLRESQAFMRLMMDINPDLIFVKDRNYAIVDANPAFVNMYPEDQRDKIIGFTTLENYEPDEAAEFLTMDKKAFEDGFSEVTEKIRFPDGITRVLETRKTRFIDSAGKPFILGSARDVSDRERLIETLTNSNQELERFAYVCSHDLQEPLRMIKSFSGKLEHALEPHIASDDKLRGYLSQVQDGASRAQQLVRDVLAYSKVSHTTDRFQEVNLNELVQTIATRLEMNARTGVETLVADSLPTVRGNETQLFQLFGNLINNALKYCVEGRATRVRITAIEDESHWEITVADNGIGIQERFYGRIFEVFRRLHRSDEYPGTGVGLALCRKIVESHGGKIWVNSDPGEGSRFTFSLPRTTEPRNDR